MITGLLLRRTGLTTLALFAAASGVAGAAQADPKAPPAGNRRDPGLFGNGSGPKKDKKFVQKLMQQLKDGKKELFVVNDKLGTPTYTHDFARNVNVLLEKEFWGLYNMVCGGMTGRLEVAQELVRLLGLQGEVKVTPVDSAYWNKIYFAQRPPSERLVDRKLDLRGLNVMRDWRVCLKEYIEQYYRGYLS